MPITSLEESINIVSNYASEETDRLLIQTAGKIVNGLLETIVYRPYYVIGLQLWLSTDNNILKGEGAEFDQNIETSRRNFIYQSFIDESENLIIPDAFKCTKMLAQLDATNSTSNSIGFIVI